MKFKKFFIILHLRFLYLYIIIIKREKFNKIKFLLTIFFFLGMQMMK